MLLSLFPGIDLFGKAFEEQGYNVVRGPDPIWGGDIRDFHSEPGVFEGVLLTPPCQPWSGLSRNPDIEFGLEMLEQGKRIIEESQPEWWIMENVARVPDFMVDGYTWQRFDIDQAWYSNVSRLRHIQFGSRHGLYLDIPRGKPSLVNHGCALASDDRSFRELKELQGLPDSFNLPDFTVKGKKKVTGNGVPLVLGRVLAEEVKRVTRRQQKCDVPGGTTVTDRSQKRCQCGCGRIVTGRRLYYDYSCRKRAQRRREKSA
jgi:DNA (cytosine-5)-methyltransferase 1